MNESEFRRRVREAIGQPPPSPSGEQLRAFLVDRAERRRQRATATAAFGLAVIVVVVLLGGYRLLNLAQRPTPVAPPSAAPTVAPSTPPPSLAPTPTPAPSAAPTPASGAGPRFASYALPSSADPIPARATVGPDGAVWYADSLSPLRIGRISAVGEVNTYPLPGSQFSPPNSITSGPDGALWFTRSGQADVIARISVTGQYAEYPLPTRQSGVRGITAGPDGALWFTEEVGNKIGRITPSGQIREYPLPSATSVQCGQLCPGDITVGPDGALWFVNTQLVGVPGIGRITTDGVITLYSLPPHSVPGYSAPVVRQYPTAITVGADGNLWFAEDRGPGLGRITPAGQITEFTVPGLQQTAASVRALTAGPDGAVWFTLGPAPGDLNPAVSTRPGQLGRIAPDGSVTLFTPPGEGTTGPIVLGKDGSMWAFGQRTVTRITLG